MQKTTRALIVTAILTMASIPQAARAESAGFDHGHGAWDSVLRQHVKSGVVDYSGIKARSRAQLEQYIDNLEGVTRAHYGSWNRREKLAFWLNAYNAYTVDLIVDNLPVRSIMKLGGGGGAIFKRSSIPLGHLRGGTKLSLNDIENRIIRPDFQDPRIHFALVCAAKSCPPLISEAYTAESLNQQLESVTRSFIRDRSKNRYDSSSNTLYLSRIFQWYAEDFQQGDSTVAQYVGRYLGGSTAKLIGENPPNVSYLEYDWSLNGR